MWSTGGSDWRIETVGSVLDLDKVGLEPDCMFLILFADPNGRHRLTALSVPLR
jgi:hypothetical protein